MSKVNVRALAAQVLYQVGQRQQSLTSVLPQVWQRHSLGQDKALLQELCYGVLRWYGRLDCLAQQLLQKPLRAKDQDVYCLLLVGLYQLVELNIPSHAAVHETVAGCLALKKSWAKSLLNGLLRTFLRERETLLATLAHDDIYQYSHPAWLLTLLRQHWPQQWPAIVAANNQRPPLCVRVNEAKVSRTEFIAQLTAQGMQAEAGLHASGAVYLTTPCTLEQLPGFAQGWFAVQDEAAQCVAPLFNLQPGMRVLDACAAPGGKTAHLAARQPQLGCLHAVDKDAARLAKVEENQQRLQFAATLFCADAAIPEQWWDGELYDAILVDAPCSATGVIRRHPDIKVLRTAADIIQLNQQQLALLQALWPLLKSGGCLLYTTCSVLPEENEQVIRQFTELQKNVTVEPLEMDWAERQEYGVQVFPQANGMDGFYYAKLTKVSH